jgi:lipid-binding SYLF domain-containing protein
MHFGGADATGIVFLKLGSGSGEGGSGNHTLHPRIQVVDKAEKSRKKGGPVHEMENHDRSGLACLASWAWAQSNSASGADQRGSSSAGPSELQQATEVIEHMTTSAPDKGVPKQVLAGAKCVAVIPMLIKDAFVVGGEHGNGVATCRANRGNWSPPAPFKVSGISWGPQIGGKSTDPVMFVMNEQGMNDLMAGHIKVGADVSAAAGPVGRASAAAGWKAGILTYSSSKGRRGARSGQ